MIRHYTHLLLLALLAGLIAGCSTENPEAGVCNACHGYPPDGTTQKSVAPNPVNHTLVNNLSGFLSAHDDCATCHGVKDDGNGTPSATGNYVFDLDHQDGNINMNVDTQYNINTFGCDAAGCHSGNVPFRLTSSGFPVVLDSYGAGSGGCDTCHGYPPTPATAHAPGATPVDHSAPAIVGNHSECNVCHGYSLTNGPTDNTANGGDAYLNYHRDGNIELNGISIPDDGQNTDYQPTGVNVAYGCNRACHPNDLTYQLSDSGLPVQLHEYGSGDCLSCHDGSGPAGSATTVTDGSPHTTQILNLACEECHGGHSAGTIEIPNNITVGINYTANGESGIALGVTGTASGATEAEICWNCHDAVGVSEWGVNTGTGSTFNYGSLTTSNWTVASWSSAEALFTYKGGPIQSTHAANPDLTNANSTPGIDAVADIRCSYCHDVHDLNRAPFDVVSGKPYLRGTWKGNPYLEDGAPQAGTAFGTTVRAGAVPRGGVNQDTVPTGGLGGYQIDQNNNFPTWDTAGNQPRVGWQPEDFAGLCELCHGNADGTWTAAEIDNLNYYGTPATDWVGVNGHANAVIGGNGGVSANARNIFDLRGGVLANSNNPAMAFMGANDPGDAGFFGFRSIRAAAWHPQTLNGRPRVYNYYDWGATIDASTIDDQYHHFSCSKCHNPHAARLPRLMINNCLDTRHNTWDDNYQLATGVYAGTNNLNRSLSNWTSAQNCHRLGGVTSGTNEPIDCDGQNYGNCTGAEQIAVPGTGAGWNEITPFD